MPGQTVLPIPQEIPWKLAASTQKLKSGGPSDVTISLFQYQPDFPELSELYPDEQLIYLKYSVSICPVRLDTVTNNDIAKQYLNSFLPVWHLMFDLKVIPKSGGLGGIRPYFLNAAPLRREMIQTGVIGAELFEDESDAVSIGKSGSELHETMSSGVSKKTKKSGFGFGGLLPPFVVGGSVSSRKTTTAVDSTRDVDQVTETTNRDASQERRELLSHTTNVKNVLTLMSAKHIGSPYLRHSLSPRPLQLLAIDQNDPNLWLHELLARRSSGIEGIQEFITVVAVPRGEEFCIEADLYRMFVIDSIPEPPDLEHDRYMYNTEDYLKVSRYLDKVYPPGTPIEELDVDILPKGLFAPPVIKREDFLDSVVEYWFASISPKQREVAVNIRSLPARGEESKLTMSNYKNIQTVWNEMLTQEYQTKLIASPVERGTVGSRHDQLKTCFRFDRNNKVEVDVVTSDDGVTRHIGNFVHAVGTEIGVEALQKNYQATATRWNSLDKQLANYVSQLDLKSYPNFEYGSSRDIAALITHWSGLSINNELNLPLSEAVSILSLSPETQRKMEMAGVRNLSDLAAIAGGARQMEMIEEVKKQIIEGDNKLLRCMTDLESLEFPLDQEDVDVLLDELASGIRG